MVRFTAFAFLIGIASATLQTKRDVEADLSDMAEQLSALNTAINVSAKSRASWASDNIPPIELPELWRRLDGCPSTKFFLCSSYGSNGSLKRIFNAMGDLDDSIQSATGDINVGGGA